MKQKFDVAVVGAGPAGSIAALVLARAGRSVMIIDRAKIPARRVGESLPSASRPLLQHLDLMSVVENGAHAVSYGNHSAWGSEQIQSADFIRDPNGLGWHLDRVRFDEDLRVAARAAGVQFLAKNVDDVRLNAGFVIDASGRGSHLARRQGAVRTCDDNLTAVYAWIQPAEGDVDGRTLVESAAHGWWYTARLPDGSRIVVFHTDADQARVLVKAGQKFINRLNETVHIKELARGVQWLTGLHLSEACGARLDRFSGEGWLATGDAALSFDPLSSQGMFNALYSGMKAGETAHRVLSGEAVALAEYNARLEEIRKAYLHNRQMFYTSEPRWTHTPFWKQRWIF